MPNKFTVPTGKFDTHLQMITAIDATGAYVFEDDVPVFNEISISTERGSLEIQVVDAREIKVANRLNETSLSNVIERGRRSGFKTVPTDFALDITTWLMTDWENPKDIGTQVIVVSELLLSDVSERPYMCTVRKGGDEGRTIFLNQYIGSSFLDTKFVFI